MAVERTKAHSEPEIDAVLRKLDPGDREIVQRALAKAEKTEAELRYLADHDSLTGLLDRRRFRSELDQYVSFTARYGGQGAMMIIDIDGLKAVNDTLGHHAGDNLIRQIAGIMRERVRGTDIVARLSGDEFAVLMPQTDISGALQLGEDLRAAVAEGAAPSPDAPNVTISVGITMFGGKREVGSEMVLIAADQAMYRAKEEGRNQIALFQDPEEPQRNPQRSQTTSARIREVLEDAAGPILDYYGVTETGNFEGRNVLSLHKGVTALQPEGLDEARAALFEARARRVRPGLDDKRLASWNALAIAAFAEAGAVLACEDYLDAARRCGEFVLGQMREDGRLLRTYNDGKARLNAYLEDHAFLLEALLTIYESTFEQRWFDEARALADTTIARFGDPERGGFFSTSDDHEALIARRKEVGDHPIPSGNSSMAMGLLRLAALTGERAYEQRAEGVFHLFARTAPQHPEAFAHLLRALDFHLSPTKEVALIGDDLTELAKVVRSRHRPHQVLAGGPEGTTTPALLQGRTTIESQPTAYVCEHFTCQAPTMDPKQLEKLL